MFGHLALDVVSGSDMRVFTPFSAVRVGPHWLAMGDWLAVAVLVVATAISIRRPHVAAWTAALGLAGVLVLKADSQAAARRAFDAAVANESGETPAMHPDAVGGRPFIWRFYDRLGSQVRIWRVDALTGSVTLTDTFEATHDRTAIARSLDVPVVAVYVGIAHLPFPRLETSNGRTVILWSDPRDCVVAHACQLSFGAVLNSADEPVQQVIRVGPFEQTRPLPASGRHDD